MGEHHHQILASVGEAEVEGDRQKSRALGEVEVVGLRRTQALVEEEVAARHRIQALVVVVAEVRH